MATATAQAPVAVVEDVKGKPSGVEFMDYVAPGKVIKLGPKDTIVLGYMKSCWRETITGGTVVVGAEQSLVHDSDLERVKVDCHGAGRHVADQKTQEGAATVFRGMATSRPAVQPQVTIYGLSPILEVKGPGRLVIERLDKRGERQVLTIGKKSLLRGRFYDFAKAKKALTPGASYLARLGGQEVIFNVDPAAKPGATPVISRLVRLE
ncbi:MAG: hypothetical protein R3D52_12165 [Xanthobacteraceae bacterium]